MIDKVKAVKEQFEILGDFVSAEPYGSGHIKRYPLRVI